MQVLIDTREKDRIKKAYKYYALKDMLVGSVELPIGDFLFSDGKNEVIFEFKTIPDFVASILDHRVFNQAIEMAENYDHHFVIIHGDLHTRSKTIAMSRNYRELNLSQYISAISSLNRYTTVLQVFSPYVEEAFYTMEIQAKKCLQNKPIVKRFPRKDKNPALNFLMYTIYGINAKKAHAIVEAYDLKTLSDLQELTIEKLIAVDGIGQKNAERIIEAIK